MKCKGFTLVELLAVIIILGTLAIIIFPRVSNSINNSLESSNRASINGLIDGFTSYVLDKKAMLIPFSGCSYNFETGVNDCDGFEYNGVLPNKGSIDIDQDGVISGIIGFDDMLFEVSDNKILTKIDN